MSTAAVERRAKRARAKMAALEPKAFVTPEGVDLRLRVATYGERVAAFLIDGAINVGVLVGMTLLLIAMAAGLWKAQRWAEQAILIVWMLGAFALRNLYFVLFELGPRAATPGKRLMGLRVAARDGGRLTADAVVARNAMREIEIFLPIMFLAQRGVGVDGALISLGMIWSAVFVLFPLFNRERLRLGDMAAGTVVIVAPKRALQVDLAVAGADAGVAFTTAQLDAYGIKELHVLEQVLRAGDRKTIAEVSTRIRAKIGWETPMTLPDRMFLQAYYAGLRDRLEGRMVMGKRRVDKFDR